MFGLFEVETAKCGQQPVPQLQGKGTVKAPVASSYTGMFVGVYPPEKTHRPRKKMVFRGVAADIYIYIYSWVGGFMVSNVFNVPPY